jgi:1,4-dihydroxy-2-naphthoate octaprenyltransferase
MDSKQVNPKVFIWAIFSPVFSVIFLLFALVRFSHLFEIYLLYIGIMFGVIYTLICLPKIKIDDKK